MEDDDRLVSPVSTGDDEEHVQASLRPRSLAEFIGQTREKRKLGIAIQAARGRDEPLDHLLLHGPPGLGKTTLSNIVSHEMGGGLVTTSGPALEKTADLMGMLTNLQAGDVLFIDEIHRTPRVIEEYLYAAMEDFKVDFVLDKGPFAKAIQIPLKRFTLVGATTRVGLLSAPLRDRFGLTFALDFYAVADLTLIVDRSAGLLDVQLGENAAQEIARRSRGTPRIANRLLRRVRDFAQVHDRQLVDLATVRESLELEGVDPLGLDDLDRRYLTTLIVQYEGGPAGIAALAATMQQEQDTLEDVVEPFLLHEGFVQRTSAGRRATAQAVRHLGLRAARPAQPPLPLDSTAANGNSAIS
ncbi:MAG: Holliday junction branch migration DNA helicase RuvB [Chloroflexi bacterium]|nr:Holliday junction branch migration DNA helicase RuvB [Chloroflexota bacterium]